jgi:hypothetical protein
LPVSLRLTPGEQALYDTDGILGGGERADGSRPGAGRVGPLAVVCWAMRPVAGWTRDLGAIAVGMAIVLALLIVAAARDDAGPGPTGVDPAKVPALAKQMLPVIHDVVREQCAELPPVWVVAEVMAESGWNAHAWSNDSNGGAAGLYQINQRNWVVAGGQPWASAPPPHSADIYQPETQLRITIPWVCTNLRAITGHLKATGKPTAPLDGMLVCHIAGCGRVTGSATGVPRSGEAGCGRTCASLINRYLKRVHQYVAQFSAPAIGGTVTVGGDTTAALPPAQAAFLGPKTGCTQLDPTTSGCLTATTRRRASKPEAKAGLGRTSALDPAGSQRRGFVSLSV